MIDSKGGAFGFDCCLASPKFRVFQQPAKGQVALGKRDCPMCAQFKGCAKPEIADVYEFLRRGNALIIQFSGPKGFVKMHKTLRMTPAMAVGIK